MRFKIRKLLALPFLVALTGGLPAKLFAQKTPVQGLFPEGTIFHSNIDYAGDGNKKHLLDIYLPPKHTKKLPLVIWIHGGAWMLNDKYADMSYMRNTVREFIDKGYALASIDYRYSTEAVFPAQIRDCNQAVEYLFKHASEFDIDRDKFALIGFSAGGHLASLLALSNNNKVLEFYADGSSSHFKIKCVLDFYGPSNLLMLSGSPDTSINNDRSAISRLLGALAIDRPDLAVKASPVTYLDKDDPPFFIVQGEKDESVPNTQSKMLSNWLGLLGVRNQLVVVAGAPHFGEMFDKAEIRDRLFSFLSANMQ